jgi:tetratricopeptide (TPR) repeat protein
VQLEPGYERAWECLSGWSDVLGCPAKALESARELTARRGGEARSWLFLARLLDAPEQFDERLAALDKAIELNPRCTDAYDLRALALAQAGRWDEAEAACRPAAWNGHPPMELRARSAWLLAERGDVEEAIQRMREVVAEEPQFYGGWSRLADWCRFVEDQPGYLQAAEALVRINPQYEVSLGYLGEARLMNGDREGSREAYRHAFELNPQYEFAGNALFDLQLEDGDLSGASATIRTLKEHSKSGYVIARDAQLASREKNHAQVLACLRQACTTESETTWPVEATVQAAIDAELAPAAFSALEEEAFGERPQPEVGGEWVLLGTKLGHWHHVGERLKELLSRGEIGERAVYVYVEALYKDGRARELVDYVHRHREWLRSNTLAWGAVGYALTGIRNYAEAASWQQDWRERQDARPWMLVNVVEGLRNTGRDAEAAQASLAALEMPQPKGQHLHRLWLAADAITAGDMDLASEYLEPENPEPLDADYGFLDLCVRTAIDMATAEPDEAAEVFASIRTALAETRREYQALAQEPARKRVYLTAVSKIAACRGTLLARLWAWWIRLNT